MRKMFFRRRQPETPSFEQRLEALSGAGFQVERLADGSAKVSRGHSAAVVGKSRDGEPQLLRAGRMMTEGIASLVDGGYQKFWESPSGRRMPALADHLKELHAFEEDLRESLDLVSLYNTSLGTTNDLHDYDRLKGRERRS
jgi:hypothetical protein